MKNAVLLVFASVLLSTAVIVRFVRPVSADGIIYIRADGSVDPPTAPIQRDGDIYTFTDDIYDEIVVERDNIVVDGAGYTLLGKGSGTGINLTGRNVVTIRNLVVKNFYHGIHLLTSNSNSISGNTIEDNGDGIYLNQSSNNNVSGNKVISNDRVGIGLYASLNNNISAVNQVLNNKYGIYLKDSSNNNVSGNTIDENGALFIGEFKGDGIYLFRSSDNDISENTITKNKYAGIHLDSSDHNIVTSNKVLSNKYGIRVVNSIDCDLRKNNISKNEPIGIFLSSRWTLTINNFALVENYISNNGVGLWIWKSNGTTVYHNKFLNNLIQVSLHESYSTSWDNGSEGNYWSDYIGVDDNGDHIGDTPYEIDENNQDKYPLMVKAVTSPPFWTEWWFWAICALVVTTVLLFLYQYAQRRKAVKAYERQLEKVKLLIKEDAGRRGQKIKEFEKKYGLRIRRLEDDLEDILERMGIKKKGE